MENSQFEKSVRDVLDDVAEMLIAKNRSYGDSAMSPLRIFSRSDRTEQIRVRIDDKLSRMARGNGSLGEDTVLDLIGYLVLLRVAERMGDATSATD